MLKILCFSCNFCSFVTENQAQTVKVNGSGTWIGCGSYALSW